MLKVQFTSDEGMGNDAPIHECESEIDQYTGHYVPYSLQRVEKNKRCKLCNCQSTTYLV